MTTPCPSRNRSGSNALIDDRDRLRAVGHLEAHGEIRRRAPRVPSLTSPPSRMRVPGSSCFSTTSVGELKNTMESLSVVSTSAAASAEHAETGSDQERGDAACGS